MQRSIAAGGESGKHGCAICNFALRAICASIFCSDRMRRSRLLCLGCLMRELFPVQLAELAEASAPENRRLAMKDCPGIALAALITAAPLAGAWCAFTRGAYFRGLPASDLDEFLFDTVTLVNPNALASIDARFKPTFLQSILPAARVDLDLLYAAIPAISRAERAYQLRHRRTPGPFDDFVHSKDLAERIESARFLYERDCYALPSGAELSGKLAETIGQKRRSLLQDLKDVSADKPDHERALIPYLAAMRVDLLLLDIEMIQLVGRGWFDRVLTEHSDLHRLLHRRRARQNVDVRAWCEEKLPGNHADAALAHFDAAHAAARSFLKARGL